MRKHEERGPEKYPVLPEAETRKEVMEETEREGPGRLRGRENQGTRRGEKWLANSVAIERKGRRTEGVYWVKKPR